MKIGLVGYSGGGKSTLFELLTAVAADPSKVHSGQAGMATVPDERFDRLVDFYKPKKTVPTKIELFDTPSLNREAHEGNAQRLGVIREAVALVHVIGLFAGCDPLRDVSAFEDDLILADMQVLGNRIDRLKKDVTKPRPDRDALQEELDTLLPIAARLADGMSLRNFEFNEAQQQATRSFSLLSSKRQLVVLNTPEAGENEEVLGQLEEKGVRAVAAPFGLELELEALSAEERDEFAAEMGLGEPSKRRLLEAIFKIAQQMIFYTCNEKEVHAWLLRKGGTAIEAADSIHSDLARGFIRAEITPVDELFRLGSERELKASGLQHVEGKDYVMQEGDEIDVRFSV